MEAVLFDASPLSVRCKNGELVSQVKHLPASATAAELRERFARFGALVRCTLAPSNTAGGVE